MTTATLIEFLYIHCTKDSIQKHEAAFDEDHYRSELHKGLESNITITSVIVEVNQESGQSTDEYSVKVMVKGPSIDLTVDNKGEFAAPATLKCVHDTVRLIRETKEKLKP